MPSSQVVIRVSMLAKWVRLFRRRKAFGSSVKSALEKVNFVRVYAEPLKASLSMVVTGFPSSNKLESLGGKPPAGIFLRELPCGHERKK